jgi:hypothetical protein
MDASPNSEPESFTLELPSGLGELPSGLGELPFGAVFEGTGPTVPTPNAVSGCSDAAASMLGAASPGALSASSDGQVRNSSQVIGGKQPVRAKLTTAVDEQTIRRDCMVPGELSRAAM